MTAAVTGLAARVFVGKAQNFESMPGSFSPTSSTLILGEREMVLVDAQHIRDDVAALGDMIEATGKRLAAIYITHGHGDHYLGIGELIRRFPGAVAVTTRGVLDYIERDRESAGASWKRMFGDRAVTTDVLPRVFKASLDLEGHKIAILEVGQGDIEPSTVLHVPEIDLVVPGDVVYNKIHMMLGLSTPEQWERWIDSIDQIEGLKPKMIVAGHKRPDMPDTDVQRILDESRGYIRAFAKESKKAPDVGALVAAMTEHFPDFGNLWTLQYSATRFYERQQ
jgi:glyoxylase-like metal-dependent hydrolase (beta-lactamase superfamily II)